MKEFILAADSGSRLPLVYYILVNRLIPLGNKPAIDYFVDVGITVIRIVVSEVDAQIKDYFGDGTGSDVSVGFDCNIGVTCLEYSAFISEVEFTDMSFSQRLIGCQSEIRDKKETTSNPLQIVVGDDSQIRR